MESFKKAFTILEFDKVLEKMKAFVGTESGREAVSGIRPCPGKDEVDKLLSETKSAKKLLALRAKPPFGDGKNVLFAIERACKGASLTPKELLEIGGLLRAAARVKAYPQKNEDIGLLRAYFDALCEDRTLERAIGDAIIAEDAIADGASDTLYKIRREMRKCESGIRDTLAGFASGAYGKYLQENIITQRNGRFVVPVKAEYKNEIKGLTHDASSSGATLFIEPLAVLEGNNRLGELKGAERAEIEKILARLSEMTAESAEILRADYFQIRDLSVIFGKADYAFETGAVSPVMGEKSREINLINARHPLIDKNRVVPVSVAFGDKASRTLVITGPNTGGKTVALKTIGLLSMMAQSGLEIPCDYGSALPVFDDILPDIGDEQSIEQSLSTFSSHMKNIVGIIEISSSDSLVLLDELGAGTDPAEGAALAVAILEDLKRVGAAVAATTHYAELKAYAIESEGVINAACEFDAETLKPTYRLITGMPGKSNAFAISRRLGLPERIIDRAKDAMSDENTQFDAVLKKLSETESRLAAEREQTEKLRREAEKALAEANQTKALLEKESTLKVEEAREKARRILAQAKSSGDFIFAELHKIKREVEKDRKFENMDAARAAVRAELKKAGETTAKSDETEENYVPPRPFRKGDEVFITGIGKRAYVESVDGETATVRAGIITTKVKTSMLRLHTGDEEKKRTRKNKETLVRHTAAVKNEVDLRGLTGDEANFVLDQYFDNALLAGHASVSVIHGKGTGALRAAVWDELKRDKRVRSFRSGRYGEGDTGVTIVELSR